MFADVLCLALVIVAIGAAVVLDAAFGGWGTVSWGPPVTVGLIGVVLVVIRARARERR